jgi:CRISPR-associated endonuclease/helicase Cas3
LSSLEERSCHWKCAEGAGQLAGTLHDLGKYTAEFQARLHRGDTPGPIVDHATAGAQMATWLVGIDRHMAELSAYVVAGHHAGLPASIVTWPS